MTTTPSNDFPSEDRGTIITGPAFQRLAKISPASGQATRNLLAGGTVLLVITLNLLAYAGRLPLWALNWPYSDKVFHFLAYAGLTRGLFARLGHARVQIGRGTFPLFILLTAATALGDEGLQSLSPARSLELADLMSNLAGMSCAWVGISRVRRFSALQISKQLPALSSAHDPRQVIE